MENEGFNILAWLQSLLSADNIWNLLGGVGVAAVISAWISSKSTHKNPIIRFIDQLARDLVNIVALNVNKARNADDDR